MPIYTRTGDKGKTSLFSGKRVWKSDSRVDTYGTIDELNSVLGVVQAHLVIFKPKDRAYFEERLTGIQRDLFSLGSYLADLPDAIEDVDVQKKIAQFEKDIDAMTEKMPPLNNFIVPGGGVVGAFLQQSRTIARRAERRLIDLAQTEKIDDRVIAYINRLSDLLFTMSRFANSIQGKKETIWER